MAASPCSGDGGLPQLGYFRPNSAGFALIISRKHGNGTRLAKKNEKPKLTGGRALRCGCFAGSHLWLGVLLRLTCREGNSDYNGEKISQNGNRKGSHRRRFFQFLAAVPPGFARDFCPIGRSFYSDLAMGVFKIEF